MTFVSNSYNAFCDLSGHTYALVSNCAPQSFFAKDSLFNYLETNILALTLIALTLFFIIVALLIFRESLAKNHIIGKFLYYVEHELSNVSNFTILLSLASLIVFLDLLTFVSSVTAIYYNSVIGWVAILVVFMVLVIPIFILHDHSFYFLAFLRGSSTKSLLLWELVVDYINVVSFFLRINIQLIRVLIVTIFFMIFNEAYEANLGYPTVNTYGPSTLTFQDYYIFALGKLTQTILYMLYELGHF